MTDLQSAEQQNAFLEAAVNKLWERFENRYGSLWMDRWAGLPMARVKAEWAQELSGFPPADLIEILRGGFEGVRDSKFPPTLPEFMEACRAVAIRRPANSGLLEAKPLSKEEALERIAEIKRRTGMSVAGF